MKHSKRRWGIPALVLAVAAVGVWFASDRAGDGHGEQRAATVTGTVAASQTMPSARSRGVDARGDDGRRLMRPVTLAEVRSQFPFLSETQLRDGRQLIGLDTPRIAALGQGDDFALTVPGQPSRQALVESAEEDQGVRRIEGRLLSADDLSAERFTLTLSPDHAFVVGHVWMGNREYTLQVRNGAGWWSRADTAAPSS
ncbi:hypothetical protein P6166_01080 [Stenotrophomonas sp. HITSZ_GD]|uniref:hypothetical protein n=1 Tax=Stenotrophomonas sp. HITSZ_GD TaxID=3037248 RepID=UPI00240E665C|nr:hypothetical protein [Stenotrophomonas sp. HITSZ_GD]MDG2523955.1 hypothetical protein [Stenotrophomonas sp. HITSZ_GD]